MKIFAILFLVTIAAAPLTYAGGGPETILLVVNARSHSSLRVANAYIHLRNLPAGHVLYLNDVPSAGVIDVETFRQKILKPIRDYLSPKGLPGCLTMDTILFSTGFPYGVNFDADAKAAGKAIKPPVSRTASLTGLTYLYRHVENKDASRYLDMKANHYYRRVTGGQKASSPGVIQPTLAFSARHAWTKDGEPQLEIPEKSGESYMLAVMLGYTGRYGNSVPEVIEYLGKAAQCDGTDPEGTFYLLKNSNVRSRTREPFFPSTVAALRNLGRKVEVLEKGKDGQDGVLPRGKDDAIGLLTGTASFRWPENEPPLLPGSIAEHLTSFGAHFGTPGQTKCTEFFRHGAAGTSGTVAEPYAIAHKFPAPHLHVHYAKGCSLAEAFYQSVWGPYQLLILGDPLARPFAKFAEISLAAPGIQKTWKGDVTIRWRTKPAKGKDLARVELWVDGKFISHSPPGESISWDTRTVPDGAHDLRLIGVESGPVRTRSSMQTWISIANNTHLLTLRGPSKPVSLHETFPVHGKARGPEKVELFQGGRILAAAPVKRGVWSARISAERLGMGRSALQSRGLKKDRILVVSHPFIVEISAPESFTAMPLGGLLPLPGLQALVTDEKGKIHECIAGTLSSGPGRRLKHDLESGGIKRVSKIDLKGALHAPALGVFDLELVAGCPVRVEVDDKELVEISQGQVQERRSFSLCLEKGRHTLRISAGGGKAGEISLSMGGDRPTAFLSGGDLSHLPRGEKPAAKPSLLAPEAPTLADGKRGGKGIKIPGEGLRLGWKSIQRKITSITLFPLRGKEASLFPMQWSVEVTSSKRGKWRPVKNLRVLSGPGPEAPKKGVDPIPLYLRLLFDPISARSIRIRPDGKENTAPFQLTEVEVRVKSRKR